MVSIVIVNYNTFRITCSCIESIIRHTNGIEYEIIVVDNASPDDKPDMFLERFPTIILVKSRQNGGFSKGNNMGINAANGEKILLLNSDTLLTEDSISIAVAFLSRHSEIGALTVRLTYPDGKLQHTARKFRSIRNELLDLIRPVLLLIPYKKRAALMLNQYYRGDFDTYCDWVSGAFMLFNRNLLDALPGNKLDERFFMYGEDQLWCYQFTLLGYRNFYMSTTTVIHIHSASTAPSKQMIVLKKLIALEKDIMEIRKGKGGYYYIFSFILTLKEMMRYYIKVAALKLFKYRIR